MHTPPARINFRQRRFAGLPWRDIAALALSVLFALALLVAFPRMAFVPKAIAAIIIVAFGAGLAFLRPEQLTVEHWLIEQLAFRRRTRVRLKGVLKRESGRVQVPRQGPETEPDTVADSPASPATEPLPSVVRAAPSTSLLLDQPMPLGTAVLFVTLFIFSILTSLTLYLASGGAERLHTLLRGL